VIPELEKVQEGDDRDTYFLNMGPQHPSMHGVLRLLLELRGEEIVRAQPVIGYSHRAHEKMAENRNWLMFLPNTSRIDYLSGMIYNLAWCQTIERWVGIEVPERAEYIRVICSELNRISSHLLWLGTFLLDIGGITPFLYAFDDREQILAVLDRVTGSRLTYCYGRFGGVTQDVDQTFVDQTTALLVRLRERMAEYDTLLTKNVILRERCEGVGVISQEVALAYGVTGPCLRATGIQHDVRKTEPYSIYERFDFEIPTRDAGDAMARWDLRIAEMEQSMRIIEQAVAGLPEGDIMAKKVPKRMKPPAGEWYFAVESARGLFGTYIVSDGGEIPLRVKLRTPSFSNLSTMPAVLGSTMIADTVAIVGSVDVVMPEIDR
jgi:NADH-quinone oxidoreductase subunit D